MAMHRAAKHCRAAQCARTSGLCRQILAATVVPAVIVDAGQSFLIWITDFARLPGNTVGTMGPSKYSAVTIVASRDCCAAVQELVSRKILAATAPRLPLTDCTSPSRCQCRFKKFPDRRDDDDDRRQLRYEVHSAWYPGPQRRKSTTRRRQD
jgi:hypothetical protein